MGQDIEIFLPVWALFATALYAFMKVAWADFDRLAKGPLPQPDAGDPVKPRARGAGGLLLLLIGGVLVAAGLAALRGLFGSVSPWFRLLVVPGIVFWGFALVETCRAVAGGHISFGGHFAVCAVGCLAAWGMWVMPAFEVACLLCIAVLLASAALLAAGLLCLAGRRWLPPKDERAAALRRFACAGIPLLVLCALLAANVRTILGGAWLIREGEMALRSGIAATTMGPWITADTLDAGFEVPVRLGYYGAARAMALIRAGDAGWPCLIRCVREGTPRGKILAIVHMERRRTTDPDAIRAIADALGDEDAWVRSAAAHALGKIGAHARSTAPLLVRALDDESVEVRAAAALAVGRVGADDEASAGALRRSLSDRAPDVVRSAREALAKLGRKP